jgi:valyl-tRNA synthetase
MSQSQINYKLLHNIHDSQASPKISSVETSMLKKKTEIDFGLMEKDRLKHGKHEAYRNIRKIRAKMTKQNGEIETKFLTCLEYSEEIKQNINELLANPKFKNLYYDQQNKKPTREQVSVKECIEKLVNLEKLIDFEISHLDNSIHMVKQ